MIENIVQGLKLGELYILPSDTLYGIACVARDFSCVQKVFEIKKRSVNKQFPVHYNNLQEIEKDFIVDGKFKKLSNFIWPGGVSVVLKVKEDSKIKHIGETVAVRIPDHKLLLEIISKTGPLVMTSANLSNQANLLKYNQIYETFKLNGIKDDEKITGLPSTIISYFNNEIKLIRRGIIDYEKILMYYNNKCL